VALILLVSLTIASGLALIVGSIWTMVFLRANNHPNGSSRGAVANRELISREEEDFSLTSSKPGKASSEGEEPTLNFGEMKEAVKRGYWRNTLPILLAIFGFLGLLLFGSLALFVALEDKLLGSVVAAVAIFSVVRVAIRMVQA
jgi:hypothetical protein